VAETDNCKRDQMKATNYTYGLIYRYHMDTFLAIAVFEDAPFALTVE
jgi:hypothetical protein